MPRAYLGAMLPWAIGPERRIAMNATCPTLATIVCALALAGSASAATPEQIADAAWPQSPCHGQPVTEIFKVGLIASDTGDQLAGYASGLLSGGDGMPVVPFVAARCEITTDPVEYAQMTPERKCLYKVHEYGHLAGLQHAATGPMSTNRVRYYAPCATLRGRVRHDIAAVLPTDTTVACDRWRGRVMSCRGDWVDGQRERTAWFRARRGLGVRGELYTIRRVRR